MAHHSMVRNAIALSLWICLALAAAAPAHANNPVRINVQQPGTPAERQGRIDVLPTPGRAGPGGYGYVRVHMRNPDTKPHTVGLHIDQDARRWGNARETNSSRSSQRLAAGEERTVCLPILQPGEDPRLRVTWDGRHVESVGVGSSVNGGGAAVLSVGEPNEARGQAWLDLLIAQLSEDIVRGARHRGNSELPQRTPDELPNRWPLLSGFDLIFVDAAHADLTEAHQRVLLRYCEAGGNLLVWNHDDAVRGPFAELGDHVDAHALGVDGGGFFGRRGLGRWCTMSSDVPNNAVTGWIQERSPRGYDVSTSLRRPAGSNLPNAIWTSLAIPGLGKVPVRSFFFLILAFAILVGPVSYIWLRRRRRLPLLILIVPLIGFLTTGGLLAYGLLSEGLGVMGITRSVTVLDQRSHEAAAMHGQTLYAGIQPSELRPQPSTLVASHLTSHSQYDRRGGGSGPEMHIEVGGRLGGGLLPSRTPVPLVTVQAARARARLRFRSQADGSYEVLAADDLRPLDGADTLLLRTADGTYFQRQRDGGLKRIAPQPDLRDVQALLVALAGPASDLPRGDDEPTPYHNQWAWQRGMGGSVRSGTEGSDSLSGWLLARLADGLPKSSYVARVASPPLQDDMGLSVAFRAAEHIVLGLLAEEDLLDE